VAGNIDFAMMCIDPIKTTLSTRNTNVFPGSESELVAKVEGRNTTGKALWTLFPCFFAEGPRQRHDTFMESM
jgi:hypothetical protein